LDDPVAPVPDVPLAFPDLVAIAGPVAVTPYIHPVPAPALAVTGAGQELVHHFFQSVGGGVAQECLNLFARRRQANQVEVDAAQEDMPGSLRPGLEPALLLLGGRGGLHESVHPGG